MSTSIKVGDYTVQVPTLCTSHVLIQGASGSGKSYLVRVVAEQLCPIIQTIVIDPEGEYNTLREKFPFVLVGEGGETPASVDTAELLARRLVEIGCSAICDLYSLEREQRQVWVRTFLSALMSLPRSLWKPMVVIIDEAHLFCPEKGEGSALSTKAVEDLASRGRKHGIGIILATQRITKLSNNAASEMQNYFIGRTFIQTDREKAAKVLGVPKRNADMEQFYADLKVLKPGQFWALGVAIATERALITVQKAQTTHPEPGTFVAHKPPAPSQVRNLLPQLADLPKEVEAEQSEVDRVRRENERLIGLSNEIDERLATAEADLLRERTHVGRLEDELRTRPPVVILPNVNGIREKLEQFDKTVQFEARLEEVTAGFRRMFQELAKGIEADLQEVTKPADKTLDWIDSTSVSPRDAFPPPEFYGESPRSSESRVGSDGGARTEPKVTVDTNVTYVTSREPAEISGGARKLLAAMLTYPHGLSRTQARSLCGFAERTLTNYVSELSSAKLLVRSTNGIAANREALFL